MFVIIIVLIALSGYLFFDRRSQTVAAPPVPAAASAVSGQSDLAQMKVISATDQSISDLVQKVFKHIFLPGGSVQVQKVVDADKLRAANPVFYQLVRNGDYLLLYSDRAILYDPGIDKVLDVYHIVNNK